MISFFHSSLHAVAFREQNFVLFHRDGSLIAFTERILAQLFTTLTSAVHHAH